MSMLPWRRHGPGWAGGTAPAGDGGRVAPVVLALHAWGSSSRADFADSGFADALADRGVATLACDRPGHADAAEIRLPADAEPAAWTAGLIAADVAGWVRQPIVVVGHRDGALLAAHLAVRGEVPVAALVLVGCDGHRALPVSASAASQIADPQATVWDPAVSSVLAELRRTGPHALPTLARWLEAAAWPATPRLGALRVPAVVVADAGVPRQRQRAPAWAACFHDGSVATVGGDDQAALASASLHETVAALAVGDADRDA